MDIRLYQPEDREHWLDLMAELCAVSVAWEAIYLEHPRFHPSFDFIAEDDGRLVGALAGHLVESGQKPFWSSEILGVHPDHQGKGVAWALLEKAREELAEISEQLVLWTRCPESRAWYRKMGFPLVDQRYLERLELDGGELHVLKEEKSVGCPLWAFATSLV